MADTESKVMLMSSFRNSPFQGTLDVVATLAGDAIEASVRELRKQDELTLSLRAALRYGVSIDELSAASGLAPAEIRRRTDGELHFGEDLATLAGTR